MGPPLPPSHDSFESPPPHQSRWPPLRNEAPPLLKSKAIFQEMIHRKKLEKIGNCH